MAFTEQQKEDIRAARRAYMREYRKRPEFQSWQHEYNRRPETKERLKVARDKYWLKQAEKMKEEGVL